MTELILVDVHDREIGTGEVVAAHRDGLLHRAVSVVLFDVGGGRTLLQRRVSTKSHSAGRWANAACTHPRPGEPTAAAAARRLREELGLDVELAAAGRFTYRAEDPRTGVIEHELDHVFVGVTDAEPRPEPSEVAACRWWDLDDGTWPQAYDDERFAPWLRPALDLAIAFQRTDR